MSMVNVRSYLRSMAQGLSLKEWKDGFNSENIPESILDKVFFIDMGDIAAGDKRDQYDQEITMPCTVKIFKKGYKTPADAIDDSVLLIENLIKAVCNPDDACTQANGIVNVTFANSRLEPIATSNDNAVMSSVTFNFKIILNV